MLKCIATSQAMHPFTCGKNGFRTKDAVAGRPRHADQKQDVLLSLHFGKNLTGPIARVLQLGLCVSLTAQRQSSVGS